jgi:hypothetical protein
VESFPGIYVVNMTLVDGTIGTGNSSKVRLMNGVEKKTERYFNYYEILIGSVTD